MRSRTEPARRCDDRRPGKYLHRRHAEHVRPGSRASLGLCPRRFAVRVGEASIDRAVHVEPSARLFAAIHDGRAGRAAFRTVCRDLRAGAVLARYRRGGTDLPRSDRRAGGAQDLRCARQRDPTIALTASLELDSKSVARDDRAKLDCRSADHRNPVRRSRPKLAHPPLAGVQEQPLTSRYQHRGGVHALEAARFFDIAARSKKNRLQWPGSI